VVDRVYIGNMTTETSIQDLIDAAPRNKDGRLTKRAQAQLLDTIDTRILEQQAKLAAYDRAWAGWTGEIPAHITDNWNGTHDIERALETLRRNVEVNRSAHPMTETEKLIFENMD
jgi:hypothetical protein